MYERLKLSASSFPILILSYSYEPRCSLHRYHDGLHCRFKNNFETASSYPLSTRLVVLLPFPSSCSCSILRSDGAAEYHHVSRSQRLLVVSFCRHYLSSSVRWAALDLFPIGTIGYTIGSREKPKQGIDLESGKFGIWTLLCIAVTNRSSIFLATSLATRNSSRYGPLQLLKCYHPWGYIQLSTG